MAYTLPVRIAAHQALLNLLAAGSSGTAVLRLLDGTTTLADLPIDHTASSVSGSTGALTLVPQSGGATWAASGTVGLAQLIARDATVLEDAIPVEAGFTAATGKVVLSSLTAVSGGRVDLISAQIG